MSGGSLFKSLEGLEQDQDEELPEETTAEDASNAVLVASSVLATYLAESPYKVMKTRRL